MAPKVVNISLKLPLHCVYIFLVIAAMALSVPRLFMKNQPRTRANTIALGMGAKSLIFVLYQLLTEYVRSFQKRGSLKAYWILNALDIVFWAAVCFLVLQANLSRCVGVACSLSWVVVGIAIVLSILATWLALIDFLHWRSWKAQNGRKIDPESNKSDYERQTPNQRD